MREPEVYKPPIEAAEIGRRHAGNWHLACMLTALIVIVRVFLVGGWQPPRWFVMAAAGAIAALASVAVGVLVNTLNELSRNYWTLLTGYAELFSWHAKRAKFMIEFTPTRETVETVLQYQARQVLTYHRQIVELHERGITSPDADDPETQLAATKRNFEEKLQGLETQMQRELTRFRELRDNAKWAGETRFNVRESWWDYVPPEYLPAKSRRADRTGLSTPIDASGTELVRSREALEQAWEALAGSPRPQDGCGCPPDDCSHGRPEAKPAPDGFVAHEGSIRPHPFRKSTGAPWSPNDIPHALVEGANEQPGE